MPFPETLNLLALRKAWSVDTEAALHERDRLREQLAAQFDTDFDTLNRILTAVWALPSA